MKPLLRALFVIALTLPIPAMAAEKFTAGGSCSSDQNAFDWDTGWQCQSGVWAKAPLFVGSASAYTCNSGNAGLLQWTGSAFQGCDGSSWQSLWNGTLNIGTSTSAANPRISGDATSGLYTPAASTVAVVTAGTEAMRIDGSQNVGIGGAAATGVALDVGNRTTAFRPAVGTTAQQPTCSGTIVGAIRYDTTLGTIMMCDGTAWRQIIASSGNGTPSVPSSGTGYIVMSSGTFSGGVSGLTGANAYCLADLNANPWLNKSDALSRGILNSGHVQAWLCDAATCNNALASTTYTFATSGSSTGGGATMIADASGYIPGNSQDWSGANYFGGSYNYWSNRAPGTSTLANAGPYSTSNISGNPGTCNSFATGNSAYYGYIGATSGTSTGRWAGSSVVCTTLQHLMCLVNPGSESSPTLGYFVMTNTTYDGNLGGRSGANAKCLTELTGNTNWMGYSTANAAGRLTSGKVFAFICDGTLCNGLSASTPYAFAMVGSATTGGATFTTDASGFGPYDNINSWSGTTYFGGSYDWWSNRTGGGTGMNMYFNNSNGYSGSTAACNAWSTNSSGSSARNTGITSSTSSSRWDGGTNATTCDQLRRLICVVNP